MRQRIRVLLHGFINMNVMDGSAVFLNGLAKMLSLNPAITIDLLLATPIQRDILLKELYLTENIQIISPFDDKQLISSNPPWFKRGSLEHAEAAHLIAYYWEKQDYDWLFIRGMEVVDKLYDVNPGIFKKIMTYVTGITSKNQHFSPSERATIETIFSQSEHLLCQTEEMKQYLLNQFPTSTNRRKIITLNPMIPDTTNQFDRLFEKKSSYHQIAYVGKFHHDWNSIPMIVGFKEVRKKYPQATFSVVGDKFTNHQEHPNYNQDLTYLLTNTENLHWYGALTRSDARRVIIHSDIGVTWRTEHMNDSLELSTKLLEYGSLGKAVVMNRTPMHEAIFGEDYPFYANSLAEYEHVICSMIESPELYYQAAKQMFEASQRFTYTSTLNKLSPFLFKHHQIQKKLATYGFKQVVDHQYTNIGNKNEEFFLFREKLDRLDVFLPFYMEISEWGNVEFTFLTGNEVIVLVKRNNNPFKKNVNHNISKPDFEEIIARIEEISLVKEKSKQEIKQLKEFGEVGGFPIEKQSTDLERIREKYNALSNSLLGRLTLTYWKFRKRKTKF